MENILKSRIIVSGASRHWSGDVNGSLVSPKIVIKGLNPDGTPYGIVEAQASGVSTDGGSASTLWSIHIPFGKIERTFYDEAQFRGKDGCIYHQINEINPDSRHYIAPCDGVEIIRPYMGECWEILKTSAKRVYSDFEKKLYGQDRPMKYETIFIGFPSLAQIDAKWEKLMEIGVSSLSVRDDKVVVLVGKTYIDFDEV
jgi:hypothetical protein